MSPYRLRAFAIGLTLLAVSSTGGATTVIPPDFPQLVNESDYIVRVVVKSVTPEWRAVPGGSRAIFSRIELDLKQVVAGRPPNPLVLDLLGGTIGDRTLAISDAPEIQVGDESILFIQGNGKQVYPLVRMKHGLYRIHKDPAGRRDYIARSNGAPLKAVSEVSLPLRPPIAQSHVVGVQAAQPLAPDEFVEKIRAAVTKAELRDH